MRIFAVIDTNVLVSALLSKTEDSSTRKLIDAIADGLVVPVY